MSKYKSGPIEDNEPMRKWERLVLEHFELLEDKDNDTSARRNEIHKELQSMHKQYQEKHPQFFRDKDREQSDDEFER